MIKELENKIGQLQYEISLLGHSEEDLTGVTIRTDELKDLVKNLSLSGVVASLPSTDEINSRLKHVVENSFEDNEIVEKREYGLGFRACYNWLKIKQMKSKG